MVLHNTGSGFGFGIAANKKYGNVYIRSIVENGAAQKVVHLFLLLRFCYKGERFRMGG